jgi:hypothetical protein
VLLSLGEAAQLSSQLLGFNVVGARDGSWGGHNLVVPCCATKSSHVGVDVDGQSLLMGTVPSHRTVWAGAPLDRLSRECEAPGTGHLAQVDCPGL